MDIKQFEVIIDDQLQICRDILIVKAKEYATDDDRLHNFKVAAQLQGIMPRQALAGFMAKHTVSIYDMLMSGKDYTDAMWMEKITDHINYLLLLAAVVKDEEVVMYADNQSIEL